MISFSLISLSLYLILFISTSATEAEEPNLISSYKRLDLLNSETITNIQNLVKAWKLNFASLEINVSSKGIINTYTVSMNSFNITEITKAPDFEKNINVSLWESNSLLVKIKPFLTFQMSFDLTYKYGQTVTQGKGTLIFATDKFEYLLTHISTPYFSNISISTLCTISLISYNITIRKDNKLQDLVDNGIKKNINTEIRSRIEKAISTELQAYYLNFESNPMLFKIEPAFPDVKITFSISNKYVRVKNLDKGMVFYYDYGVFSNSSLSFLQPKNTNAEIWDQFDENLGNFQLFFDASVIRNLFNFYSNNNQFYLRISKENFPTYLNLELNIEYLGRSIPGNLKLNHIKYLLYSAER